MGVAYMHHITPHTTKLSHSHGGFLRRSQGTGSLVMWSQAVIPVIGCDPSRSSKYGTY